MNAQLRVLSGPFVGDSIRIDRRKFIVGREQDCQLRPVSEFISRYHCVLLLDDFTLRVRDLGSKNGTFVNGRRITGEVVLCHDDMISLGEMTMQVDLVTEAVVDQAQLQTGMFDGNTIPAEIPQVSASSPPTEPATKLAQQPAFSDDDDETHHIPPAQP